MRVRKCGYSFNIRETKAIFNCVIGAQPLKAIAVERTRTFKAEVSVYTRHDNVTTFRMQHTMDALSVYD